MVGKINFLTAMVREPYFLMICIFSFLVRYAETSCFFSLSGKGFRPLFNFSMCVIFTNIAKNLIKKNIFKISKKILRNEKSLYL